MSMHACKWNLDCMLSVPLAHYSLNVVPLTCSAMMTAFFNPFPEATRSPCMSHWMRLHCVEASRPSWLVGPQQVELVQQARTGVPSWRKDAKGIWLSRASTEFGMYSYVDGFDACVVARSSARVFIHQVLEWKIMRLDNSLPCALLPTHLAVAQASNEMHVGGSQPYWATRFACACRI